MGTCERMMRVEAPADVVWEWMSDPRNLFRVNMLHAEVVTDETGLAAHTIAGWRVGAVDMPRGGVVIVDEANQMCAAGAQVVLRSGELLAWIGRTETNLLTFLPADEPARAAAARELARALARLV